MRFPGVGRSRESCNVIVRVDEVTPSAAAVAGNAAMPPLAAGGTLNVSRCRLGSSMPSVVSVAVNVTASGVRSVTLNTKAPFVWDVTPLGGRDDRVAADAGGQRDGLAGDGVPVRVPQDDGNGARRDAIRGDDQNQRQLELLHQRGDEDSRQVVNRRSRG